MEQETELKRLREENVELRKRVDDFSSLESAKKKLESKVESLEFKVCGFFRRHSVTSLTGTSDGRYDPGESRSENQRVECDVRREATELRRTVGC